MATMEKPVATFERNIEAQTGKSVDAWAGMVRKQKMTKHAAVVGWLKSEHALSHAHANHIAKRVSNDATPRSVDDPVAHMFEGKEAARRLHDRLVKDIRKFGADVEFAPKKANVSVRRSKQFALIQPTRTRVDLGLILKGRAPTGRLEASGSFNAMFTHRVKLTSLDEIDAELLKWLREAYREAAS